MELAFVLLRSAALPEAKAIVEAWRQLAPEGPPLRVEGVQPGQLAELAVGEHARLHVALMPAPVPGGEAEEAARFSVARLAGDEPLPAHAAHLVVVLREPDGGTRLASLQLFTYLLAAVLAASDGLGVYWGGARATHPAGFFLDVVRQTDALPLLLWTGVSFAADGPGRLGVLSLGMAQLGVADLLVTAPSGRREEALELFFDLLALAAQRGEPVPEGETVGRTEEEQLPVRGEPSPLDPQQRVWRVDLPA